MRQDRMDAVQRDSGDIIVWGTIWRITAVRAVLEWWLSGGTIRFVQFPLVFGWVAAVLTDLRVAKWVYQKMG